MIDLRRFTEQRTVYIPIVDGWGQTDGRKIYTAGKVNGWYKCNLGNDVQILREATPLEVLKTLKTKKAVRVYALGTEGIPVNFDNFLRQGLGETVPVYFLNLPLYEVGKAVRWEDGRFYYYEPDIKFQRSLLTRIKGAFEKEQEINSITGATPELRYYFLLTTLQRDAFRAAEELNKLKLSEAERAKRIKEFESTFSGRLQTTIEKAGGKLVKFYKANSDTYMIHWKVKDSNQLVKSSIKDNMQILNLGFCASGADRQHTLSSAVQLAKMYGSLYITRE